MEVRKDLYSWALDIEIVKTSLILVSMQYILINSDVKCNQNIS